MAGDNRGCSSLFRRAEQLKRWEESETNQELVNDKVKKRKVKFSDGCIFLAAAAAGDQDELHRLLDRGADINTVNQDGITALHAACIDNNMEIVEFLVDNGADINRCDMEGWTPLHATASCGSRTMAKFLIDRGADLSVVNNDGELAIDVIEEDDMGRLLQEEMDIRGVDCDASRSREERNMLEDAQCWLGQGQIAEKPHHKTGATALHVAAAKGYIRVMRLLIQAGADINAKDFDGWTSLHAAVHWGQTEAVEILCDSMANMDILNYVGQAPYDLADDGLRPLLDELKRKQASIKLITQNKISSKKQRLSVHTDRSRNKDSSKYGSDGTSSDESSDSVERKSSALGDPSEIQSWRRPSLRNRKNEEKITDSKEDSPSLSLNSSEAKLKESKPDDRGRPLTSSDRRKATSCLTLSPCSEEDPSDISIDDAHPLIENVEATVVRKTNSYTQLNETWDKEFGNKDVNVKGRVSAETNHNILNLLRDTPQNASPRRSYSLSILNSSVKPMKRLSMGSPPVSIAPLSSVSFHVPEPSNVSSSTTNSSSNLVNTSTAPILHSIDQSQSTNSINKTPEVLARSQSLKERLQRYCIDVPKAPETTVSSTISTITVPSPSRPVNSLLHTNRSFVGPSRDEESETQRKAHAKMVRSTRRSTQGITLEDVRSAEQLMKAKQEPVPNSVNAEPVEVSSPQKPRRNSHRDDEDRRPSWRLRVDNIDKNRFSLEDVRPKDKPKEEENTDELRKKPVEDKKDKPEEKTSTTREGTQAVIHRKKKAKRRSTGVVHVDMDEIDPDRQRDSAKEDEDDISVSEKEGSGKDSSKRKGSTTNGDIDYKKLYEEQLTENDRLMNRLRSYEKELRQTRETLATNNKTASTRNAAAESERREKRSIERKLSEMEEELRELEQLRQENQRLRDENGALIRVISKLSR